VFIVVGRVLDGSWDVVGYELGGISTDIVPDESEHASTALIEIKL
jgi:hypothetical protein